MGEIHANLINIRCIDLDYKNEVNNIKRMIKRYLEHEGKSFVELKSPEEALSYLKEGNKMDYIIVENDLKTISNEEDIIKYRNYYEYAKKLCMYNYEHNTNISTIFIENTWRDVNTVNYFCNYIYDFTEYDLDTYKIVTMKNLKQSLNSSSFKIIGSNNKVIYRYGRSICVNKKSGRMVF